MGFTFSKRLFISLHFAKKKTHENRSGESRIAKCCGGQNQKLKLNFLILLALEADHELPRLHRCEKRCEMCFQA